MSTDLTWQTDCASLKDTARLAREFGRQLRGGEIIELVSDVGGGKTTFVQGLAQGMGSIDKVASPSFTISREYKADELTLLHFDFYRLDEPGIIADELAESIADPKVVIAIEWADIIEGILPTEHITICILNVGETARNFQFAVPEKFKYLKEIEA